MNKSLRETVTNAMIFQDEYQRPDLLSPDETADELLACLFNIIIVHGFFVEVTAVRRDHHNDIALGPWSHARGRAIDLWPLIQFKAGKYADPSSTTMQHFLIVAAGAPHIQQIGLGGSVDILANRAICGNLYFPDNGEDHIHLGCGIQDQS